MNFFERQNQAKSKTRLLVALFVCATVATFLAVHLLVSFFVGAWTAPEGVPTSLYWRDAFVDPTRLAIDCAAVAALVFGGSLFKVAELKSLGPDGVATALNGRLVSRSTTDPTERRLLNVVEETSLASGVRAPNVYILADESVNACAIGGDPNASVIAVTKGCLRLLNRDELQGVVAHEFSHILNGDVKINMRLIGVLFGLQMLSFVGFAIFRSTLCVRFSSGSNDDKKDSGSAIILAIWAFALGLIVVGAIGVFFSNIIRAAVSRQREFLADASAVQFTRNPAGIAGALKKIGAIGSGVSGARSAEMAHLFFGGVFSSSFWNALFRSHPPLDERIRRIEPTFDGKFPPISAISNGLDAAQRTNDSGANASRSDFVRRAGVGTAIATEISIETGPSLLFSSDDAPVGTVVANELVDSIGEQAPEKLDVAASLLGKVPEELDAFLGDAESARAVVFAALLDSDAVVRETQLEILRRGEASGIAERSLFAFDFLGDATPATKLCATNLAFPLLKTLTIADYRRFRQATGEICAADGKLDLFEYTIQAAILNDLDGFFRLARGRRIRFSRFADVAEPFATALSYLAREGSDDPAEIQKAFDAGAALFDANLNLRPESALSLGAFGRALNLIASSTPTLKRRLLTAFYRCVAADGVVTEREGALIYAISAALGAPAPIWTSK